MLIKDYTSVARAKLEILFRACVDRILKASITPFTGFWIDTLKFHEICDHSNAL